MKTETFSAVVEATTEKAVLLDFGDMKAWIPISQIVDCDCKLDMLMKGDDIEVELPLWLAKEKELL